MTTQTKPLDVAAVRALLVRAVEEKGADYVYPKNGHGIHGPACNYFRGGKPSCIVGHILHYLGITADAAPIDGTVVDIAAVFFPGWDRRIIQGLQSAQNAQDDGKTWGEALAAFDKAVQS